MNHELSNALCFVGPMFIAIGLLNIVVNLRHGLSGMGALVGLLGLATFLWANHARKY